MKNIQSFIKQTILCAGLLLLAGVLNVHANIYKAATATMSAAADWTTTPGGVTTVAPTASVIGEFGSTPTSGNLSGMALGGSTSLLGLLFDNNTAGPLTVASGSTLTLAASGINMSAANNNATFNCAVALGASQTWAVNNGLTLTAGGVISGSTFGITKTGAGTLDLNGSAVNTYTGGTVVNAGTLLEDFSNIGATANLINSGSALTLGGGTLQINGNASSASSQTFASYTLNAGGSAISAAPASGVNYPSVVLNGLTENVGGTVEFVGPATINSAGNVAATATITTTTAGTGAFGAIGGWGTSGKNGAYATVGLYDYASTDTTGGSAGTTVIGGSQVTGFYQTTGVTTTTAFYDVNSGGVNTIGNVAGSPGIRFNSASALTITSSSTTAQNIQGFLVTPKCGANNETITGNGLEFYRSTTGGACYGVIWQNNTLGYLNFNSIIEAGRLLNGGSGTTCGLVQAGVGTVVYGAVNDYDLNTYLDGGYSVITADSGFGRPSIAGTVYLNGGTVVGNANFTMDNSGANFRPFAIGVVGGGLAATAGHTMSVDGYISGSGALTIGCGTLPGSGATTANTTAVVGSGTVNLNGAGNGYSGGTIITGGATAVINCVWALGGGAYGGLTFNNGTLQYAATQLTNAPDITEDTSNGTTGTNGGVAKPVTLAGNATIDVNGLKVVYTNAVGNSGSGALTVASTISGGSLKLMAANTYTGATTISGGTLALGASASLASQSITVGSGATFDVSAQSYTLAAGKALLGSGTVTGSVSTASSAMIIPGTLGTTGTLTFSNNLTLNTGATNYLDMAAPTGPNDLINVVGTLAMNGGTLAINFTATPIAGTYKLFTYGAKSGALANLNYAFSGYSIGSLTAGLNDTGSEIDLVLSSAHVASAITWLGDGSINNWDTSSLNWTNLTASSITNFFNSDSVTFDNLGSTTPAVNLTAALAPGSVTVNSVNNYTFSGPGLISGATALTNSGSGTLTILTTNTYTGGTVISSGTVQLGNGTVSGFIGTGGVTNNGVLIMDSPIRVATGAINGSGNVTVEAGGTLAIGGNSTINTLTLGSSGTNGILDLTNSSLTVSNLAIAAGATTSYIGNGGTAAASTINYNGGTSSFAGVIEDVLGGGTKTVALNVNSSGILTLTAANTYSGGTVINSGQVTLTGSGSLGGGLVTLNGGTLFENGAYIANTISNAPSATSTLDYYGAAAYYPAVTVVGGGTLNLNLTGAGPFSPGGSMSGFAGTINLSGGIRASIVSTASTYGSANATWNLGTTGGINNKYGHQTVYLGALNGSAGSGLTGGNTANGTSPTIYVVGNLNTTNTFGGTITDGSADYTGLTKVGSGVLILTGENSYTSPTIVSNGTLEVDGTLGDYGVTTNYAGATLAGSGTFAGPVDMESGSTLAPGTYGVGNVGTLTFADDGSTAGSGLSENGCTNLIDFASSTSFDVINVTGGGLSLAGANVVKLNITGTLPDGNYTLINYNGGSLISGSVVANMTVTPAQVGNQFFTLVDTGSSIQLQVITLGTASLTWIGDGVINFWDTSSPNWTNYVGVDDEAFTNGDSVTFNAVGVANSPVDLQLPVSPSGVTVSGSASYTFKSSNGLGKITGSITNGLTMSSTGTLTILTTNDFTGPLTISAGTVQVGDGNTLNTGLGAGVITNNALLVFDQTNNNYTVVTNLTGTGSLVQEGGSNTVTLAGNTTYSGTTLVDGANAGTLQFGNGGATAIPTNTISLTNNGTINFDLAGTYAVSNGITGLGTVVFNGPGTNTFGGVNTYINNTYIKSGMVQLAGPAVLPVGSGITGWTILDGGASAAGTLGLNGHDQTLNGLSGLTGTVPGKIVNNGGTGINTLTISNIFNPTYAGQILDTNVGGSSGKIALVIAGAGTQTLTGVNTYSGGTTIYGTLAISQAASIGTNMITLIGGTLTNTANLNLNAIGLTVSSANSGTIDMPYAMKLPILYGSGTLALNVNNQIPADSSSIIGDCLSTCANFTGTLNATGAVANAILVCNFNNVGGGSFDGNLSGATVNLITGAGGVSLVGMNNSSGNTAQFGALNVDASSSLGGAFYAGSQTYQIGALGTQSDIEGVVTNGPGGASAITKVGIGTLILGNVGDTYTGKTTVNAGTLLVNGQITASPVTVNTGGALAGVGTIGSVVTNNAGAILYPGNGGIGTLTLSSNLTLNVTSTNRFVVTTGGVVSNSVAVTGQLSPNGSVVEINTAGTQLAAGTYYHLFTYGTTNGTQFTATPVFDTAQSGLVGTITNDGAGNVNLVVSAASTDASLLNLVVNSSEAMFPTFSSGTTNYTATNVNASTTVTVLVTNNSAFATNVLYLNGSSLGRLTNEVTSVALPVGVGSTNVIRVQVTAQDGLTVSNYFVTVTRQPSSDASLFNLVVNASVSPTFISGTTNYYATNINASTTVTVLVTNNSAFATNVLYLNGTSYGLLTNKLVSLPLAVGVGSTNVIRVQVTAQDGLTVSNYFVTVTRLGSTNDWLANLVISNGGGALTFYPSAFTTNNTGTYFATNASGAGPVTVLVTNVDATATNTLLLGGNSQGLLTNEIASAPLTLAVGTTNVTVQVVSQDLSQTNNYIVALTQLGASASPTTYLTSLVVSNAANAALGFNPTFQTNTVLGEIYAATNSLASTPLTVTVVNVDSAATNTLFVNGTQLQLLTNGITSFPLTGLVAGTTNVTVQTVSQDLMVTNNYTVNVTLLGTNSLLSSLSLTPAGTLSPTFNAATNNYNATNTYVNKTVIVAATSADANATLALSFTNGAYGAVVTNSLSVGGNTLGLPTNTLAVRVVSQDLSQTNIYTVNVLLQPSQTVPHLTNSVSGNNLVLSWPADHLGYHLLVQTNNLNKGVSGNINDWGTVAGTTTILSTNIAIIKSGVTNEYYKLVYP
jgi:autotransporter-associated beta strand protein